ncbi:hypothetical protein DOTSEDRAFT_164304 [Dothistroma septosporum NZE10]|uniref:Alpha/beta hydrolase fold-3 domain-containing protein n=1 Tax=Dothistroma septosporum (strain NZE10 / CBS 128990) TaxID=675120 RepID=N1Q3A0_DOTSN|nr:hypothetical protein DOTSEDRAFT_164304 [Dothistroma septosporum NZE10]
MLRCRFRLRFDRTDGLNACRRFSVARKLPAKCESVQIPCQSNGSISLDVYEPLQSPVSASITGSVLLYLPRRSVQGDLADDVSNISALQSAVNAHIVRINYRAGDKAYFPTPVHDVIAGYDWVVSNLLPKRAITRVGRSEHVGRIAVCGELIGGGLATTLALTECRIGEPGIVAAAVNNPITDWVELDEITRNPTIADQELELETLLNHRDALFRKPEHFHDPFASPMLFFRSAGTEVPEHIEGEAIDEMEELSRLERVEYLREHGTIADMANLESLKTNMLGTKRRKATRRYPSRAVGLRLPAFRVTSGNGSVLSKSTTELAAQLQKSYDRQIDSGVLRNVFAVSKASPSDGMLQHEQHDGLGPWDGTESGRRRMQQVGEWLAHKLAIT